MPAERRYKTNAERQRAYRERKQGVNSGEMPPEPDEAGPPTEPSSSPVLPPMPNLDSYVADAVYAAELHHSQASPGANMSTKTLAEAIERAESYARWRYQGVLDGEVNGL